VTSAEVHDSNATAPLLDEKDKGEAFYADSAYTGKPQEEIIKNRGMKNKVCKKGYRNMLTLQRFMLTLQRFM
jgi:IS5 family transposase